eukprot:12635308-Alexandrium_andersonii.AAC.1
MTQVDRCVVAAENLKKVVAGEMDLAAWNEAEEEFERTHEWKSFATCDDPAEMREAADYKDE